MKKIPDLVLDKYMSKHNSSTENDTSDKTTLWFDSIIREGKFLYFEKGHNLLNGDVITLHGTSFHDFAVVTNVISTKEFEAISMNTNGWSHDKLRDSYVAYAVISTDNKPVVSY